MKTARKGKRHDQETKANDSGAEHAKPEESAYPEDGYWEEGNRKSPTHKPDTSPETRPDDQHVNE